MKKLKNLYRYKNKLIEKKILLDKRNNFNEVSDIGIFYLILTGQTFDTETQKKLLINYNDSIIFKLFVYPYINYDSISEINESIIFSNIFIYLKKCCDQVMYTLSSIDSVSSYPYNGHSTRQLFFWKKPKIENINEGSLKVFLTYHLKLPWVYNAEIKEDSQDKNIIIIEDKSSSNKAIIRLLEDKSKAKLIINNKKYYDKFIIRKLSDNYYSVEDFEYSIGSPNSPITVKENSLKLLLIFAQQHVQILIFSILLSYGADMKHPIYEILKKDNIFMQSLKKTNYYFNQRCKDITE